MKYIKRIIFLIIIFLIGIGNIEAKEDNLVNIYLFYSSKCPHCKAARIALTELEEKYSNIEVYKYEVSNENNYKILVKASEKYNFDISGVPVTIIGSKVYRGFDSENGKKNFEGAINYFSKYGYKDLVGEYLHKKLPTYDVKEDQMSVEDYIGNYGNYTLSIPLVGKVQTKNIAIPFVAILIGLLDGFNPCAMWILLFLISMLIGMKNKTRMWLLGLTFIVTSALVYLIIMLSWVNVSNIFSSLPLFKFIIAIVALIGGIINITSYIKHRKDDGCNVTTLKKRKKIMESIKKFTTEKNLILALIGIIALAISVNIIELACSAGLPVMFIEVLNINDLSKLEYILYIILYILMFMLDDIIVFMIAMFSLKLTGISTKYGKLTKLVGGIILLLIGLLMLFKPEWLMFNF